MPALTAHELQSATSGESSASVRALRVARTIADLAGEEHVGASRLAEALQYREYARRTTH